MTEPLWRRGAAVAAALTGVRVDEVSAALAPHDVAGVRRALAALRGPDRTSSARRIAHESVRIAFASPNPSPRSDVRAGLALLAAMLQALPREDGERMARAYPADVLRRAAPYRGAQHPDERLLARSFAVVAQSMGDLPDVETLAAIAHASLGDDAHAGAAVHAALRAVRARGIDPERAFGVFAEEPS